MEQTEYRMMLWSTILTLQICIFLCFLISLIHGWHISKHQQTEKHQIVPMLKIEPQHKHQRHMQDKCLFYLATHMSCRWVVKINVMAHALVYKTNSMQYKRSQYKSKQCLLAMSWIQNEKTSCSSNSFKYTHVNVSHQN